MQIFLSLYFTFVSLAYSQYSWERSSSEPILQEGVRALYNYEFNKAISLLDSAALLDPKHPVIPFIKLSAKWLKSQSEEGYSESYETINMEVDRLIPIYSYYIGQFPNDPEYLLYLGSTYGMRARTALASKEWLSAFLSGYRGLRYILKAEALDDKLVDIYMPIGLMEYFACLSLAPIKWGAGILGLSSECSTGLFHLEYAADKSHYSWVEAANVLAYAYLHVERDYEKANIYITKLVDAFPNHPYFIFLKAELLAKTFQFKELDRVGPLLDKFISEGSVIDRKECKLKYNYILSIKDLHKGRYSEALIKTDFILNHYTMEFDWLLGFTYFLRGEIYEAIGDSNKAIVNYKKVLDMDTYYPEVKIAREKLLNLGS